MKKVLVFMLTGILAVAAQATLIDNFDDGDVSDFIPVVMLDTNNTAVHNVAALVSVNGKVQATTTTYSAIEQAAYVKPGYLLEVGQELQLDFAHNGGSRAMGLFVGLMPTNNVRANYITIYAENGKLFTRGFNGTTEMSAVETTAAYTTMFIRRYGENDYKAGFYNALGNETILKDRIGLLFGGTSDLVIGLYTDIRAAGTVGVGDNLAIVPEPATLLILGLGALVLRRSRSV